MSVTGSSPRKPAVADLAAVPAVRCPCGWAPALLTIRYPDRCMVLKILLKRRKAGVRETPTHEVLAQRTGSSLHTIANALKQLTHHKIITVA